MSLTILASVSLFVLVSSARPIQKAEVQGRVQVLALSHLADVQQTVHAVLKSHASVSKELKDEEAKIPIRITPTEELQAILTTIDRDSVKLVVPLDAGKLHSPDEAELVAILDRVELEAGLRSPVSDEALDKLDLDSTAETPSDQSNASGERPVYPIALDSPRAPSKSVIVLVASGIAALLAVCCIATALYSIGLLRKHVLQSDISWEILPYVGRRAGRSLVPKAATVHSVDEKGTGPVIPGALMMSRADISKLLLSPSEESCSEKELSPDFTGEDFAEDPNEKYYDAETLSSPSDSPYITPNISTMDLSFLEMSATSPISILPECDYDIHQESLTRRHTLSETGEIVPMSVALAPSGIRPSWSMRAAQAKPPVVERSSHVHGERLHYALNAVPELDAALAMQLRPGLGIGADAAWLVRFLMTLFGWCTVLMTGRRDYWY